MLFLLFKRIFSLYSLKKIIQSMIFSALISQHKASNLNLCKIIYFCYPKINANFSIDKRRCWFIKLSYGSTNKMCTIKRTSSIMKYFSSSFSKNWWERWCSSGWSTMRIQKPSCFQWITKVKRLILNRSIP